MACFWCDRAESSLGDAVGCCNKCNRFACHFHGAFDPSIGKFICIGCDRNNLVKGAIAKADLTETQKTTIKDVGNFNPEISDLEEIFNSIEDFYQRRPKFKFTYEGDIGNSIISFEDWENRELKQIFEKFDEEAKKLLIAAAILTSSTETSEELHQSNNVLLLNLMKSLKKMAYA